MEFLNNEDSLKQMLNIIEEIKQLESKLLKLDEDVENLKNNSNICQLVAFPDTYGNYGDRYKTFNKALTEIKSFSDMSSSIEDVQAKIKSSRKLNPEIGDILATTTKIRLTNKSDSKINKVVSLSEGSLFERGAEFNVIDIINDQYLLKRNHNNYIIYVNQNNLNLFFEKKSASKRKMFKVDFSINGFNESVAKKISCIKLYKKNCPERKGYDWYFDVKESHESNTMDFSYDEVFGLTGTAYFDGEPEVEYKDIVIRFDDICKIGYTKVDNETFKYNGKITCFQKGNFPKDTFTCKIAERLINIIGVEELIDIEEKTEVI